MLHVHIFEIAGIGLFLSIGLLTFNCDVVSGVKIVEKPENVTLDSYEKNLTVPGVKIVEKPENVTLDSYEKNYTLKCSVDVATSEGIDWVVHFGGQRNEIFSSKTGQFNIPGYSVEQPNNRTVNLIIRAANFQNSSVPGRYCCHGENGAETSTACAYGTVTATTPTTSTYLSSTHDSASKTDEIVGGVIGGCIFVALAITLLVCIFYKKCPIHRRCNMNSPSNVNHVGNAPNNDGNAAEQQNML